MLFYGQLSFFIVSGTISCLASRFERGTIAVHSPCTFFQQILKDYYRLGQYCAGQYPETDILMDCRFRDCSYFHI